MKTILALIKAIVDGLILFLKLVKDLKWRELLTLAVVILTLSIFANVIIDGFDTYYKAKGNKLNRESVNVSYRDETGHFTSL